MPVGQLIAEVVAQVAMEAGGEAIKSRFGWQGCVVAMLIVTAIITFMWWFFTR